MSLAELLPAVQALPRAEKFHLLQVLAADLARAEGLSSLQAGGAYPIWSPFDATEAAAVLTEMLQGERAAR